MTLNRKNRNTYKTNIIKTSYRLIVKNVDNENDALIHQLMHKQQSAMRIAYNRLQENVAEKEIYKKLSNMFPTLTGWDINAAIVLANETLDSQATALARHINYLERKIEKLENTLHQNKSSREHIVRLKNKMEIQKNYQKEGTVPPAIFGGRQLWNEVFRGVPGAKEEWRDKRSQQYFSLGETANFYGNRHIKIGFSEENVLYISIRVLKDGKRFWIKMPVSYTRQQEHIFKKITEPHIKKTIRLIRIKTGEYQVMVTVDEPVTGKEISGELEEDTFAGLDINLDHIAVVISDRQGQFRNWMVLRFLNLGELPKAKSKHLIGNYAKEIISWLKNHHVNALVLEDLKIKPAINRSPKYNRRTIPFAYRQIVNAISRRALREGITIKNVNPAYTSWIGGLKYAQMYGVSRHVAAAYIIVRRGLRLPERLPIELVKILPKIANVINILSIKKGDEFREKISNWKRYSPIGDYPWLLWIVLFSIYKSGARGSHTDGRNYLLSLCHSAGNTRPVSCLTEGQDPITRIMPEIAYTRPRDKALGPT